MKCRRPNFQGWLNVKSPLEIAGLFILAGLEYQEAFVHGIPNI